MRGSRLKIVVIGSGISGNLTARLLATQHEVHLLEAADYAGGHTNTVRVATPDGDVAVDTGFMVFNRHTYPNFNRMLDLLGVRTQASDMSFSVHADATGLEYNGTSLDGLFAQRSNLLRPAFYRLLRDIVRFNQAGRQLAATPDEGQCLTLGEFLDNHQLGEQVRQLYLIPMLAAIWSADPTTVESLPARFILGFMNNHGLMQLRDRPQWRTVVGGAKQYVKRLIEPLSESVRLGDAAVNVTRLDYGVTVTTESGHTDSYDQVVLATHADQSLKLLTDASDDEHQILSKFPYQPNHAVLHSDTSQMPYRSRAWASWNYRIPADGTSAASVTYDLNRLQNLPTEQPIFVTLNPISPINKSLIHKEFSYQHPCYSIRSVSAQRRWQEINGTRRTWFCGAYWGFGFHEDGVNSALRVADAFGLSLDQLSKPVASTNSTVAL